MHIRSVASASAKLLLMFLMTASAYGVSRSWTGGSDAFWSNGGNWVGGVAPQPGDDLVFGPGAANLANLNDLAVGFAIHSISITSAGYSLNGTSIQLGAGGITASATGSMIV